LTYINICYIVKAKHEFFDGSPRTLIFVQDVGAAGFLFVCGDTAFEERKDDIR
jgi:hypothetical protein